MIIGKEKLTVEKLVSVARFNESVELHPKAIININDCRIMLEDKINSGEIIYGLNTGIGEFSEIVLDKKQIKDFQSLCTEVSDPELLH